MTHREKPPTPEPALRARAEAAATVRSTPPPIASNTWPVEAKALLHDLHVHQIELELQNEELRRAHEEVEASRSRYFDLYDLSPAGYCTVSAGGMIVVANLTLATMLDMPRSALVTHPFSSCILPEAQDIFYRFRRALLAAWTAGANLTAHERSRELQLKRRNGTPVWVTLTGSVITAEGGEPALNLAVIDISERKAAEAALREREFRHGAILDSLKASTAVLDERGAIVFVNEEWKKFAVDNEAPDLSTQAVGQDYLAVCDRAAFYPDDTDAVAVAAGLRAVLTGERPFFEREYPCHTATAQRWFLLTIVRLVGSHAGVVITHADITAVKRAEETLARTAELLERTGELGKIGGWSVDLTTMQLTWTRETFRIAERDTGVEPTLEEGLALFAAEARPVIAAAVQSTIDAGTSYDLELPIITFKGNRRLVQTQGFAELRDGKPIRIYGTFQDITERRRAEREQREAELRVDLALRGGSLGLWDWDIPSGSLSVNERWLTMLGLDRASSPPSVELWNALVHPDDAPRLRLLLDELFRNPTGVEFETEIRVRHRDGRDLWIVDRGQVVERAADGSPLRIVGTHMDITERRRVEARLRRLVESDVQGVLLWNAQGDITDANGAFLAMIGYTRDELVAGLINWRSITPPEFAVRDEQAIREAVTTGICASYEKDFIRRDGSRVPVLIGAASFEDDPSSGVAFVVDLTDRKLAERQLVRGQRLQSLGTLTSGIAHDMNNMLNPIVSSIELLRAGSRSAEERAVIDILATSAMRGKELVKQILTFSRGGVGSRVSMPVVDTLRDLQSTVRDTFPRSVEFRLSVAPGVGAIVADPTQIHQVFLNLCLNARDAMPKGGTLGVDVTSVNIPDVPRGQLADMAAGAYVRVSVTDTGSGMPPETLEQVFDPFFTTKAVGEGTGLGLSMVRGIVASHGGYVTVASRLGHGTTFTVYLPASAPHATNDAARGQTTLPQGAGETILVVDDEMAVRTVTQRMLERFGYRVLIASGGAEALTIYAERRGDIRLVMTDLSMPDMNGVALTRALRGQEASVPIVVASGFLSDDEMAEIMALRSAGTVAVVHKPYTAFELLNLLRTLLHA
ncbi:PAS domain S-box protein [Gemmatimonas sp.]|jgi:two-component system cell cycle sensor histidine kinase/response regulator CckA|uniref:PAS domain S-box protein n=1 Tax=Gemmatimonas sp. TaxID=1962908 RepID=UPI0031C9B74C|nr:PAS domain S-box protein [Gemmatimonas sp.]